MIEERTINRVWNNVHNFKDNSIYLQRAFLEIILCCDNQNINYSLKEIRDIVSKIVLKLRDDFEKDNGIR